MSNLGLVAKAALLLRALSQAGAQTATTTALARACEIPRPTAHRLLVALLEQGLVDRDPADGRWHLGPEIFLLGNAAMQRYDVASFARPQVRALASLTGEDAFLSVRRGDETVCLIHEEGHFPIRSSVLYEGARFPLGVVSAGLAVLAHLPQSEVAAYLDRANLEHRFGSGHSKAALTERVEQTRLQGFATNPGLVKRGSWGLAAAVFDQSPHPGWALSLTGVESRFSQSRRRDLGRLLLRRAHELGKQLRAGGQGNAAGVGHAVRVERG